MVTDIGTLNDKNFNEYTFKGAADAATALGAAAPKPLTPTSASQYASLIQQLVDDGTNIIVTVGFNLASATTEAACANPDVWFVGEDQGPICVIRQATLTARSRARATTRRCCRDTSPSTSRRIRPVTWPAWSPRRFRRLPDRSDRRDKCMRSVHSLHPGYELGAKSINPNVQVNSKYVVSDFSNTAFHDPAAGNTFAQQFLAQFPAQMSCSRWPVTPVTASSRRPARRASTGSEWTSISGCRSTPTPTPHTNASVTSAEKHVQTAMSAQVQAVANGTAKPGDNLYNAAVDGVGVSPEHDNKGLITPDLRPSWTRH